MGASARCYLHTLRDTEERRESEKSMREEIHKEENKCIKDCIKDTNSEPCPSTRNTRLAMLELCSGARDTMHVSFWKVGERMNDARGAHIERSPRNRDRRSSQNRDPLYDYTKAQNKTQDRIKQLSRADDET